MEKEKRKRITGGSYFMKTFDEITLTRVKSAIIPVHKTGARHKVERRVSYAISFSLGGKITYFHEGESIVCDVGVVVVHPMGAKYEYVCTRGGAFGVVNFYTTHFFTDRFMTVELEDINTFALKFEELREALLREAPRSHTMRLTYELIEQLSGAQEGAGNELLRLAVRELRARYTDADFSISQLAASVHVSESYLRRLFTSAYGISPKKYLLNARITRAKQLLSEGASKVSKIAESCGFSGVFHFCRAFRESVGQTPTEYRRNARERSAGTKWQM